MITPAIAIPEAELAEFCRRHHVRKLALFGSVIRPDFRPDSDIDVLVEFLPGFAPGISLIDMQDELSTMLANRRIDLVTEKFLNRRFRDAVLKDARVLYKG